MTIRCGTFKVRPVFKTGPEAWVCVARYVHPKEGDEWKTVGAGATAADAREDLGRQLEEVGLEAFDLEECFEPDARHVLLWSVKSQVTMFSGTALEEVESSASRAAEAVAAFFVELDEPAMNLGAVR